MQLSPRESEVIVGLKQLLPWWLRIGSKIMLARLPVHYVFWKRWGLFVHGDMNQPQRALETFLTHANTAGVVPVADKQDFAVLELGPGDSVFTALIAYALGASRTWLVDAGPFATREPADYTAMADYLQSSGFVLPELETGDFNRLLGACQASYLTRGVAALVEIPDRSIDFCFSNAVLEHIPYDDFGRLTTELYRLMKPNGVCVHRVDLKDHLGGGLNNLRFSTSRWEGKLFSHSGFYTNRIRFAEMLSIFRQAGFEYEVPRKVMWDKLPIKRSALASAFRELPDDDLRVSGFDVILRSKVLV